MGFLFIRIFQINSMDLGNSNAYFQGDLCFDFFIMYNEVK